jgi:hypothetical protein
MEWWEGPESGKLSSLLREWLSYGPYIDLVQRTRDALEEWDKIR